MSTLGAPSLISNHLAHAHAYAPPPSHNSHSYNFYMNPSPPVQYTHTQPHHGTKRSAPDDEVESSANISTHFKKLRLNQAHLPHPAALSPVGVSLRANNHYVASHNGVGVPYTQQTAAYPHEATMHLGNETHIEPPSSSDFMPVDDTPDRIYIHDLDSEIAAIEAAEPGKATFLLPDFDKNVSRIPQNVLRQNFDAAISRSSQEDNSQALILYRDPTSISVPPEEDVVRKAIIESRRAAREKIRREYEEQYRLHNDPGYQHDAGVAGGVTGVLHTIHEVSSHDDEATDLNNDMNDPDAMDIE